MSWLLIAAGGFLGALCRFSLSIRLNGKGDFQTAGTWLANMSGSALLAFLAAGLNNGMADWVWFFAGIGFSGAFTTFSTFGKETVDMIEAGHKKEAILYVLVSVLVSLFIVSLVLFLFR